MRKIILAVAALFAMGFAYAQETSDKESWGLKQGDMWAEGGFSVKSGTGGNPGDVKTNYSLTPKIGWMRNNRFGYGAFLDFSGGKYYSGDKFHTYGIGLFGRWYGLSLGERKAFNAYAELGIGYSDRDDDNPAAPSSNNQGALNVNVDIGMNYFFTKELAAVFTLANIINYNNSNPESGDNTSNIQVNLNLFNNIFATPQFGLLYRW